MSDEGDGGPVEAEVAEPGGDAPAEEVENEETGAKEAPTVIAHGRAYILGSGHVWRGFERQRTSR
jgi:hypothetical protein